jgi:RNA polymerase sigma-B factor
MLMPTSSVEKLSVAADRQLTADTANELLRQARDAPEEQKAKLQHDVVTSHVWLADSLARRFHHRGEEPDDLQQVARFGLVQAVQRYDPDQGPFLAFAIPTISGCLKRHFRDHGWLVRPPRRTQELAAQLRQQWPDLTQRLHADPSDQDLADHLGQSVKVIREAAGANQCYRPSSLSAVYGPAAAEPAADDEFAMSESRMVLARAWRQLTVDERKLLTLRFYEDRSQSAIASELGISQMQVSRLLTRTLIRLRSIIGTLGPASDWLPQHACH